MREVSTDAQAPRITNAVAALKLRTRSRLRECGGLNTDGGTTCQLDTPEHYRGTQNATFSRNQPLAIIAASASGVTV